MKKQAQLKEIRQQETKALIRELGSLNVKLTNLRFKASFRRLKNFHEITLLRKQIARIWTVLGEKTAANLKQESGDKI